MFIRLPAATLGAMIVNMRTTKRELIMLVWHIATWVFAAGLVISLVLVVWDRYRPR